MSNTDRESIDSLEEIDGVMPSESHVRVIVGVPVYVAQPVALELVEAVPVVTPRETFHMVETQTEPRSVDSSSVITHNSTTEANIGTEKIMLLFLLEKTKMN